MLAGASPDRTRWPAGPRARGFRLDHGWGACSPASPRCWCGWRWPTRWPGSSGRCWRTVGCIELRSRRYRRRHDREAVEAWEGHRRGMAHGQETGSGQPALRQALQARGLELDLISGLPSGPAACDGRIEGRTHVSTRPRATPLSKISLAPKGASTHVANANVGRRMDWISLDFTLC